MLSCRCNDSGNAVISLMIKLDEMEKKSVQLKHEASPILENLKVIKLLFIIR